MKPEELENIKKRLEEFNNIINRDLTSEEILERNELISEIEISDTTEIKGQEPEKKKKEEKEVSKEGKLAVLDNFSSVGQIMDYAEVLLKSKLLPEALNTKEKVVVAIQQGRELGLGAITALNNIHVIKGKPTLSVHAIGALLKKAGIKYKLLKDFEDHIVYDPKDPSKILVKTKITTIRFYEKFGDQVIENDFSYTWKEAELMGLTIKPTWVKMPKLMIRTRCLSMGARFIAPDAMLGMYETTEWADVENVDLNLDEEGNVITK